MQQLVIAGQVLCVPVSMILGNEFVKLVSGDEIHDLGEYIATDIHKYAVLDCKITLSFSNQKIKDRSETLINKGIYEVELKFIASLILKVNEIDNSYLRTRKSVG
jgi:hypothetical protein